MRARRWYLTGVLGLLVILAGGVYALGKGDTDPPHLVALDFEPKSVNTALADRVITFTVHLTDDLSGVVDGGMFGPTQARFRSPSQGQFADVTFRPSYHLVSGDVRDGVYVNTLVLPRFCETGAWHLEYFLLYDGVGNHQTLHQDDVAAMGFPVEFVVTDDILRCFLPAVSHGSEN